MAEITAALVKELREKTGVGMMDCKNALTETGGDIEAGVDWLRKKGLAAAAKKAGRVAAEGLVGLATGDGIAALVEINSETDFVARNVTFQNAVTEIADIALANKGDVAAVAASDFPSTGRTVAEELTHLVTTIGENINLRRSAVVTVDVGVVASYMHAATSAGLGRIGVIVGMKSPGNKAKLDALGRQVAMHIAAASPQAVSADDLDPEMLERERSVLIEQAKASGKPDNIIEKMVEGRIRKFYEEVALLHQTWVLDGESKVSKILADAEADIGGPVSITGFVRLALGEGVERDETNFATEVAQTLKS